ncbi:hypothetical protein BGX28_001770 [Mortierella sp. GBA30]|nr:hypothetical protein BGX28_001770 [Mortierella sp. GBA30]
MTLTLFHNPNCGTCKTATPLLEAEAVRKGFELEKVEFLYNPLAPEEIEQILTFLGANNKDKPEAEREKILQAFLRKEAPKVCTVADVQAVLKQDPGLMQRPIVVNWTEKTALICRPAELVLEMTKNLKQKASL